MANTYKLISSVTVGSGGAASITFSSIPQTYTDLVIRASIRDANGARYSTIFIRPNGSSSNFTGRRLYADGSSYGSDTDASSGLTSGATSTASTFGIFEAYIPNYTSSNNKSISTDSAGESDNSTGIYQMLAANLWSVSSAITSIRLDTSDTIQQYSTAYLYGISNA
jgi:hypothetical protein